MQHGDPYSQEINTRENTAFCLKKTASEKKAGDTQENCSPLTGLPILFTNLLHD
jgi:hypothetical protein